MDFFLTLFATSLVLINHVSSQSTKVEWTASEFYNPMTNAMMCGFPTNQTAYVCDPNGILKSEDLYAFNMILRRSANIDTKCPCSTYTCETKPGPKGYKIAVALVKRMKKYRVEGETKSPQQMAVMFSGDLKTKKWKMGNCDENIIVFYSVEDKMLSIDPGRTAAVKLTPSNISLMAKKIAGRLNDGQIIEALNILVYDMKILLNCDLENPYDCTIYERGAASTILSSVVPLMTTLMTSVIVYFMHH